MPHPPDLDEYTDQQLIDEIARRESLRQRGLCSYCRQPLGPDTPARCRLHERLIGRRELHPSGLLLVDRLGPAPVHDASV